MSSKKRTVYNPRGKNNQLDELRKWIDHPGIAGVKAHPFWHRFAPIDLLPVARELVDRGKPMLLHLGFDEHGDYRALLEAVPGLKLILAHAAFPCYSKTWAEIKDLPNVFVDISSTTYVDAGIMRKVVGNIGVDKCLFGTDGPFGSPGPDGRFDPGLIKRRIESIFPDETARAKLLGENFSKLIG